MAALRVKILHVRKMSESGQDRGMLGRAHAKFEMITLCNKATQM